MRAQQYSRYANGKTLDVGVLELVEDRPTPRTPPGFALVRVMAAGVNPVDWKVMSGGLDSIYDVVFPAVPGWDVAGVIEQLGPDTPGFEVGDEVMAYARTAWIHHGTFAELVPVPMEFLAHKPAGLDWDQAGALPLAGLTAYQNLLRLGTGRGSTVLIHNASGGVGCYAVQIARHLGARVIGTASARNHERLRELGAEPVAYGEGLTERVRELAPGGVDIVLDLIGGVLDVTTSVLAPGGVHGSIADPGAAEAGGLSTWVKPSGSQLAELAELAADGVLHADIAGTFALADLGQAFESSASGHVHGKIVLHPNQI
ncbi:NADP-dependent oxidoreductase [Acidipropionibacterium thoenii]|uniref:NADP-dependent oxidoreductase n=1 Tax=Acidipropionibacterium thoenii TaxID=1751 RepID=UPI000489FD40|nr:NADP-dependent oxidoreductase [Acidipropionibacterium thoenii]